MVQRNRVSSSLSSRRSRRGDAVRAEGGEMSCPKRPVSLGSASSSPRWTPGSPFVIKFLKANKKSEIRPRGDGTKTVSLCRLNGSVGWTRVEDPSEESLFLEERPGQLLR